MLFEPPQEVVLYSADAAIGVMALAVTSVGLEAYDYKERAGTVVAAAAICER